MTDKLIKLILISWLIVVLLSLVLYFSTELSTIYLVGSTFAGLWLVALAAKFVSDPTPDVGGSTFLKSTLWLWVFSLAVILDVVLLF